MAFTSSKMGLRIWNLLTDLYDHAQLADNWAKVDYHDHSPGKGVQVPTEGLADGAVTSAKLATALDPSGAYTQYKTLLRVGGTPAAAQAAGTYVLSAAYTQGVLPVSAGVFEFHFDPANYSAPGRTLKLNLTTTCIVNAVAPTATYAISLYPVASWGGASGSAPTVATLGALVASSTVTIAAPPAAGPTMASAEFDAPAADYYCIAYVQTGGALPGSIPSFVTRLNLHHV